MSLNLQNTINWAKTYVQYMPLSAGLGLEPAVTTASMIRNSFLNPPQSWFWNRGTINFPTVTGTQDYTQTVADLAYIEKASLTNDQGDIIEIKDIYNNSALSKSSFQQRPSAISIEQQIAPGQFLLRFLGVPDQIYTVTLEYQKLSPQFGPFFISSVATAVAGNTTYTGTFDALSFPAASIAVITGFTSAVNNGSFVVVSCTATTLVVANAVGVTESDVVGFVSNLSWSPIPDQYSDVYNNLFLSEMLAVADDARSQLYRQRGVAAFLAKSIGLTETQKNAFVQQWIARGAERVSSAMSTQAGTTARGI